MQRDSTRRRANDFVLSIKQQTATAMAFSRPFPVLASPASFASAFEIADKGKAVGLAREHILHDSGLAAIESNLTNITYFDVIANNDNNLQYFSTTCARRIKFNFIIIIHHTPPQTKAQSFQTRIRGLTVTTRLLTLDSDEPCVKESDICHPLLNARVEQTHSTAFCNCDVLTVCNNNSN